MHPRPQQADVCLILEGTYPYVPGGVSTWTQELLKAHPGLTFHLVALLPSRANLNPCYDLPPNISSLTNIFVQQMPAGPSSIRQAEDFFRRLQSPVSRLMSQGGLAEVAEVMKVLASKPKRPGFQLLLNSPQAWAMLLRMYAQAQSNDSFLDYFWTWRALLGGLYSVLLADLPEALVYHAVSTGYAGLVAARAHLETGRPAMLTEHGIYTTERRIEIAMADWLYQMPTDGLHIEKSRRNLKDLWVDTFVSYSRACYEAASRIITLYAGNRQAQIEDGASPEKTAIIPNGIDYARYSAIRHHGLPRRPTIALIGRVVPIKDVKTFIRTCAILRGQIPDLLALILGPTDEDPDYFCDCQALINHMALQEVVRFEGQVRLEEYLGRIDVIVLTSISEAQPLVILEAGAAGIPSVATDVGACKEMILGRPHESPPLGPGGAVTELSNPAATAQALARLLTDPDNYQRCSRAIQERVCRYYDKADVDHSYGELYDKYRQEPAIASVAERRQ